MSRFPNRYVRLVLATVAVVLYLAMGLHADTVAVAAATPEQPDVTQLSPHPFAVVLALGIRG